MDVLKMQYCIDQQDFVIYVIFYSVKSNNNKKYYIFGHSWWHKYENLFTAMVSSISEHKKQNVEASLKASQVLSWWSHSNLLGVHNKGCRFKCLLAFYCFTHILIETFLFAGQEWWMAL